MRSVVKLMAAALVLIFFVFGASNGFSGDLPQVMQLECREHACLCKSDKADTPPHEKCWGWYRSHEYNLLKLVGHPLKGAEIAAFVTGGPSEQNRMVRGYKLQVLPAVQLKRTELQAREKGWACRILCRVGGWKTLETFAAPSASGPKEIIHWEGHLPDAIALRIVAPDGNYVDNTKVWVEY